jgi:uncharacterized membrane protein/protein-disulfide isomerase
MSGLARKLLLAFGSLGLAASAAASWVHYHLLVNPDYSSFCDINATVSCRQAYLSRYGSVAGVPVAIGGIIFFTLVLLLVWAGRPGSPAEDSAPGYIFALSTIGLAVVLYLAYASFFILKEVCPICATTYVATIGVFIISGGASSVPMSSLPRRALRDVRVLVTRPIALIVAILFIGGAGSAIAFFPHTDGGGAVVHAQAQTPPLTQDQRSEFERWWDQQEKVEVPYSGAGAKVLVVKFNDYQCPPCRQTYYAYESILERYKDQGVTYLMKHFPLDPKCNSAVNGLLHPAACDAAAAAVMAVPRGTFDKLTAWFFQHQDELSPATVRTAAKEVGGIPDFDAEYPKAIQQVKTDASTGGVLGVGSTPTFFINGKRIKGGLPPQYFEAAIELELKRAK